MPKLKTILKAKLNNAQRIAVLGMGSELRADDAAGMLIALQLETFIIEKKKDNNSSLKVFLGQTAPENLTGEIKKFKPTHLIIIDAIDFQRKPGSIGVIDLAKENGSSFSTHKIPLKIIRDYLYQSIACETIIIGIQPESLEFGQVCSAKIQESVLAVVKEMKVILKPYLQAKSIQHRALHI